MSSVTLKAHYDGKHIVLDEPFELPANAPLAVTLLPLDHNGEEASTSFFASCLAAAETAADVPPDLSENVDAYLYGSKTLPPS